jgi:hypothetical protein
MNIMANSENYNTISVKARACANAEGKLIGFARLPYKPSLFIADFTAHNGLFPLQNLNYPPPPPSKKSGFFNGHIYGFSLMAARRDGR